MEDENEEILVNLENHKQLKQQKRLKLYKGLMSTFVFTLVFLFVGVIGNNATNSTKFCASCHEMSPEHYTQLASAHAEAQCVDCHTGVSLKEMVQAKGNIFEELFRKVTKTYDTPIRMPKDIPDANCEKCHNMNNRTVSPSGDIIISHAKHKANGITCVSCHSGVAHGNIADRSVTLSDNYDKWNKNMGQFYMSDRAYTAPKMDACMTCHKARGITTKCSACHSTGMLPDSHKEVNFKSGGHGKLAEKNLEQCNNCHQWMSKKPVKTIKTADNAAQQFLTGDNKTQEVDYAGYIISNTFCSDCHAKKPPSHDAAFFSNHGVKASKDQNTCLACHSYAKGNKMIVSVTCGQCHPSTHEGFNMQLSHSRTAFVAFNLQTSCFSCHPKEVCTYCHINLK